MEQECKICELNLAEPFTEYCSLCKNPGEIRGFCKKCGNRFIMTPDEFKEILELSGVASVTPALGQIVVVSNCSICELPEEKHTFKVYD